MQKRPRQAAWEILKKIFAASTMAKKLQLRQELSKMHQYLLEHGY
jgi:hypothetical protein